MTMIDIKQQIIKLLRWKIFKHNFSFDGVLRLWCQSKEIKKNDCKWYSSFVCCGKILCVILLNFWQQLWPRNEERRTKSMKYVWQSFHDIPESLSFVDWSWLEGGLKGVEGGSESFEESKLKSLVNEQRLPVCWGWAWELVLATRF